MYKRGKETFVTNSENIDDTIKIIYDLIELGTHDKRIIEAAEKCKFSDNPQACALEFAYQSAVMTLSPDDRQQLKTVRNILNTKRANCTGYVTVIGAILTLLKIPFILRITGVNYNEWGHIYLISNNFVCDATIGQNQSGRANFENRNKYSTFNFEFPYKYKKDYQKPMVSVLNGNLNAIDPMTANMILGAFKDDKGNIDFKKATATIKDIIDTGAYGINSIMSLIEQYINPCHRGCDLRHLNDAYSRKLCKRQCDIDSLKTLSAQELQRLMDYTSAQSKAMQSPFLLIGIIGLGIYLITKK